MAVDGSRGRQLESFYVANHRRVTNTVARCAPAEDADLIADACAYAWLALVRRHDVRLNAAGANWVITVAIHQAWTFARLVRREPPVGRFSSSPDGGEMREPAGMASDPLDRVIAAEEHAARLERFACAKPRERRELLLHAAGYRYAEIAEATGSTYTAVNRRLTEGRRRIRESV